MHLRRITVQSESYPSQKLYPFNLEVFLATRALTFDAPVTFFIGENGTGKSTLLEALARRCGIHIWRNEEPGRNYGRVNRDVFSNPYDADLARYLGIEWLNGPVAGSYFSADIFRDFTFFLDEWAAKDPGMLDYFGGKSLVRQSHGQGIMAYFNNRYTIRGLYLMDEPEAALSPKTQLALLNLFKEKSHAGHAQFIIASHSPILLACPGAVIYSFDQAPITEVAYEETEYFRVYKDFLDDRSRFIV